MSRAEPVRMLGTGILIFKSTIVNVLVPEFLTFAKNSVFIEENGKIQGTKGL
jgi:hypothetical protein